MLAAEAVGALEQLVEGTPATAPAEKQLYRIGLAHAYQGPAAVISLTLKSVLMGWYFRRAGRVRTLIVAHAVYDSVQIAAAVYMLRHAGL